ncbi:type III pantothenate kinase [Pelistega europaea]|uniref:Type III pantothenate kinase n=1 Tax=Pelistega europaea TaxID=106147 RepID=A0A7Y4P355_9BURK|nr:type III pantothenate kinase [Pelistega europaea]NOL48672.1 type III pantothenate kinase [Pelistega europaea]
MKKGFFLLMDSGNSRLKCRAVDALWSPSKRDIQQNTKSGSAVSHPISQESLAHATIPNDQLVSLQEILKHWISTFGEIVQVYAVSVASEQIRQIIETQINAVGGCVQWLQVARSELGLQNAYDVQQMGKDRWYGVLGAYVHHVQHSMENHAVINSKEKNKLAGANNAFLYISFGTATTIDVVVGQQYLGGVIFPGVQLMQHSLFHGTAQLPEIHLHEKRADVFPTNTEKAIESGIVIAQAGAVLRQIQRVYEQYQVVPTLYVSGGARYAVMQEIRQAYAQWEAMSSVDALPALQIIELEAPVLDGIQAWVVNHID